MAGQGKTTFIAGDILTASQVNGFLMDQVVQVYSGTAARGSALPVPDEGMMTYLADTNSVQMATGTATFVNVDSLPRVAGTATRDALYPSPTAGNTVFRTDTGVAESYYAAYSTAVPGGRDSAGWYGATRTDGLVPIQATSVVTGGTASSSSSNALGQITFALASSVSLNGIFSSAYRNYEMTILYTAKSVAGPIQARLRAAGTDVSTASSYTTVGLQAGSNGTITSSNLGSNTVWQFNTVNSDATSIRYARTDISLYKPFEAAVTGFKSFSLSDDGVTAIQLYYHGGFQTTQSSYDGFSLIPGSGTISGTISVRGLAN
jgi:hypothetical protein